MESVMGLLLAVVSVLICTVHSKPNILIIIGDDLGYGDVSFHGTNQILSPNIDMLAYSGVALGRYYTHAICTPSRCALMTGNYSHSLGMQGKPLQMSENRGVPTNVTLLPQYLKKGGYKTHLIGKWHLGASRKEYLPQSRGFDEYFGHTGGFIDYYDYTLEETLSNGTVCGLSLYNGTEPAWDVEGYITDVYTDKAKSVIENHDTSSPLFMVLAHNAIHSGNTYAALQAPSEDIRKMKHLELSERRILAAMMKHLDDSVGDVMQALLDKGILENTIVVFIADNGGPTSGAHENWSSNGRLKGAKQTPYEGGLRVAGVIWSTNLTNTNNYYSGYMHVTDWLPTLLTAAGLEVPSDIDGQNQWENINTNAASNRTIMYEIDDYAGYAAITYGELKLIKGTVPKALSGWQGGNLGGIIGEAPSYTDALVNSTMYSILQTLGMSYNESVKAEMTLTCDHNSTNSCTPSNTTVCVYNIMTDPCETTDIAADYPEEVAKMKELLAAEEERVVARGTLYIDPLAAPSLHNYTWAPWLDSDSTSS